ncbi:hypothetical protein LTR91_025493 [Friedmanniomyces endolithicus]|uniref:Uncharacterized protein n=1 Tax=Friedmanniomyces endolithicus TaxID=329885 RepID=A0AAN6GZT3_9PEZI|nr:hypothetical protein LTR94_016731 [Friedmanniomyces endolithicus]KAK0775679.1 hypothetical protein LTR59_014452 [Friedmanniomyces endolithicus]KAK0784720.1 hypothetical protein LTR75_013747 [Friedmanniomyces endolithicus]KAK0808754.1 hypothetical protein LTR38_004460 [Friedmanniomyces endolithicus]KAK0849945.1 hypothetical protein LTR03_004906 [Friedmanniomyces endolithicus]
MYASALPSRRAISSLDAIRIRPIIRCGASRPQISTRTSRTSARLMSQPHWIESSSQQAILLAEARTDHIIRDNLAEIQSVQRSDRDPGRKQWAVERLQRDMEYEVAKLGGKRVVLENIQVLSKLHDKSSEQSYEADLVKKALEISAWEKTVLPMVSADWKDVGLQPRLARVVTFFGQSLLTCVAQLGIALEIDILKAALESAQKKSR